MNIDGLGIPPETCPQYRHYKRKKRKETYMIQKKCKFLKKHENFPTSKSP